MPALVDPDADKTEKVITFTGEAALALARAQVYCTIIHVADAALTGEPLYRTTLASHDGKRTIGRSRCRLEEALFWVRARLAEFARARKQGGAL